MSSNSSNNEGSGTCCDGDGGRAVRETGQPARKRGVCDPTASVLAALPQLRPKYSQIVRYIVNHGGDFWKETRCTSHGTLREDLHVVPPYPLGGVQERKIRTGYIILALCLNIGVDPPDVSKPHECAVLESWVNPDKVPSSQNVCEVIGRELERSYKRSFPRVPIQKCLDPNADQLCNAFSECRKSFKGERVLVHYNGHGVPSPSKNGEVWVFNKDYTQYIPLSLQDAQACLGVPVMWVFDCNRAGLAVRWYKEFLTQRRGGVVPPEEMFLLGACGADEYVPLSPEYPADVFTACLTTPVRMAALWYVRHAAMRRFDPALAAQIPGDVAKRNTPLGELAWIYTTITDTIAYDILPYDLFQLLLRHDLTVATLFRNFLLAQRIMRSLGCTPVSVPTIPENYKHPLWAVLDSEIDACLSQFAVSSSSSYSSSNVSSSAAAVAAVGLRTNNGSSDSSSGFTEAALAVGVREYVPSNFFMEQLQGFDVWLGFGADNPRAPEQLPAILQMALSQRHRARALKLLSRFVDIGPAAVMQTLHIGAFTYLVRFLETATDDIRAHLTLIWTKILVFDRRYQREIARDRRYQKDLSRDRDNTGDRFFLDTLFNQANSEPVRAMAAFVLSAIMDEYPAGQSLCSDDHFISYTLGLLNQYARTRPRPLFGTVFYWWVVLALAKIWENNDVTKYKAIRSKVSKYLPPFLEHSAPEVRAATLYAYGTFFSDVPNNYKPEVQKLIKDDEVFFATNAGLGANDGSLLVRREYVFALSRFLSGNIAEAAHVVRELEQYSALTSQSLLSAPAAATATAATAGTVVVGGEAADEPSSITPNAAPLPTKGPITMGLKALAQQPRRPLQEDSGFSFYSYVWKTLLDLTDDPQPEVADIATDLVQRVRRFVASRTNGVVNVSADGSQEDPKVALRSTFYEWSTEYWKLPLIGRDFEDTTSPEYTEREKRHKAYNAMYASSRDAWADWEQGTRRDMGLQATLQGQKDEVTTRMIFHPYEKTLVCATGSENIVVWDWAAQKRLKTFPNKSRLSTRITSFLFSNEYDDTHLIVGSDDGTVKVWKDYAAPDVPPKMAASWVAIPDSRQLDYEYKGGSDVVMEWLGTDNIITCGASREIGLFDVRGENYISRFVTKTTSNVTCVITDAPLFTVGCQDGSIRLFDTRVPSRDSLVRTLLQETESGPVVSIARVSPTEVVSATAGGSICYWDTNSTDGRPFRTIPRKKGISAFAAHQKASVLAYSSARPPKISVCTRSGEPCKKIKSHDGFLGQRISPLTDLVFHPHNIMLAASFSDSLVCIYSLK